MIDEIQVKNLALIKEASMSPSSRITVLTGETGAGKTALLSACKLLMGARADKSIVREGEETAEVCGRFFGKYAFDSDVVLDSESEAAELEEERELVAVRKVGADGRSRASLNGGMASVSQLSRIVAPSIDLCGQHEHQALMRPATHCSLFDAWAGNAVKVALADYAEAFAAASQAQREYDRVCEAEAASQAQLDEARFVLRQIDAVGLVEGEYDELVAYLSKTEHAEALASAANIAYTALSDEGGALDGLNAAASALAEAARYDSELEAYVSSLREVGYVLEDVARDALSYRDSVEFDPQELRDAQERVGALQGLMRSYGPRMEDVFEKRAAAQELVSSVDDADERERAAKKKLDEAEAALAGRARFLHELRCAAAPSFSDAVSSVMARLEMGSAELVCEVSLMDRKAWTKQGPSAVEFMFKPGSGMQARPLARIASGGEMSRVMLAVKVVLGVNDDIQTLVFDEVDAGVGGATAVSLAQVLAELGETHQVIVITHLAQVAVVADRHYVVRKKGGDVPETMLEQVCGEAREREIARMLSGDITDASLAHARELLTA